ncbi:RlpA-like double-psi beta-barrel-protein domain-containing protein-containing protein [Melampsora americana]|nr:RlpA-like double-psi beta-barrel-protein domain-containing protein-containing protein [Melampsora americana]KAH9810527.1 RlpA-like double-psi beta-barrel-protein domain-containing protein-containing protein [Melampsora americana]
MQHVSNRSISRSLLHRSDVLFLSFLSLVYGTGLGACGITNNDQDYICAVSKLLFDSFPAPGGNPNENAICGRKIHATYKGRTVTVTVTDRCEACAVHDLDFSPKAFNDIGDPNEGRLHGMTVSVFHLFSLFKKMIAD